ncbi:MAG TPA: hypothetical protein PLC76_08710 [Saprospiraceae bacterium]|nr:MAG: hypothetical protein UZ08_BCD001000554 [Candidatus Parvibacillus calidus]MCC7148712.1 hypothetical protein [Saprospiraceae bacterium]WKZ63595.1 MAG: hypothetical protein QY315_02165 [Saprospiraceae bacterium]HRN32691.1 hypothetical protein [Saprospiraceae bacterium]HRP84794.1 hypothetical protein [Saprospiraceae bacterium]
MKVFQIHSQLSFYAILAFLVLIGSGCEKNDINNNSLNINQKTIINNGSVVSNDSEGISLWMKEVTEDSRCPEELDCFWPGNGAIAFVLTIGNHSYPFTLNTYISPKDTLIGKYNIHLTDLIPWPKANQTIPQSEYKAEVFVSKK